MASVVEHMKVDLPYIREGTVTVTHWLGTDGRIAFAYGQAWRCQSKILNTWSGHRTAQIDPKNAGKSMAAKTGSDVLAK